MASQPKKRVTTNATRSSAERAEAAQREAACGYSDADLAEAMDNPPLSDDELAGARPFAEVLPDLAAAIRRGRGPQKAPTKIPVKLRLEREVVDAFKAGGPGWQTRMNDALKRALKRSRTSGEVVRRPRIAKS